jgi:hypothetical protein
VEAYSPTHYQLPLDFLEKTWKHKPETGEQSTHRKKTLNSKELFEEALHGRCPWHPKSKHSAFECQTLQRAWELHQDYEERPQDYPNNDSFIN